MTRVSEILAEAQERLDTARVGLDQARMGPYHVRAGFRNVAIFGKMVTFCTNNLRGKVEGFEQWDADAKNRFFDNDVARAMTEARNQYEKKATNPIFASAHVKSFSTDDLRSLPRPDNASAFFIGDRFGGSGWMIDMENGDKFPFYIELPPSMAEVRTVLVSQAGSLDLMAAADTYLASLQGYLDELRAFCAEQK